VRKHALSCVEAWEPRLHNLGYGRVEWTDGTLPESGIQRLILAMAEGPRYDGHAPSLIEMSYSGRCANANDSHLQARSQAVDRYVQQYTVDFSLVHSENLDIGAPENATVQDQLASVLVTGATGILGSHVTQHFTSLPQVKMVVCLNRISTITAQLRQEQSLRPEGISLNPQELSKLRIFQSDADKPMLGLCSEDYQFLAHNITHIVHNAWPMSMHRPITAFESQLKC
jgi:hypothetical protein